MSQAKRIERPDHYWLVGVAGFSEEVASLIAHAIKRVHKDRYRTRSLPLPRKHYEQPRYSSNYADNFTRILFCETFLEARQEPSRFCDHWNHSCSIENPASKHSCRKTEDEACGRLRPEFIVVLYAPEAGKDILLQRIARFAFPYELDMIPNQPREFDSWLECIFDDLESRFAFLQPQISKHPRLVETPIVLPVNNFVGKGDSVKEFLRKLRHRYVDPETGSVDPEKEQDRIRKEHQYVHMKWRIANRMGNRGYRDRRDLDFLVAQTAPDGRAGIPERKMGDKAFGLSTYYRLGINFSEYLHFDVSKTGGGPIRFGFQCEKLGCQTSIVHSDHVNIYPNDVVR